MSSVNGLGTTRPLRTAKHRKMTSKRPAMRTLLSLTQTCDPVMSCTFHQGITSFMAFCAFLIGSKLSSMGTPAYLGPRSSSGIWSANACTSKFAATSCPDGFCGGAGGATSPSARAPARQAAATTTAAIAIANAGLRRTHVMVAAIALARGARCLGQPLCAAAVRAKLVSAKTQVTPSRSTTRRKLWRKAWSNAQVVCHRVPMRQSPSAKALSLRGERE